MNISPAPDLLCAKGRIGNKSFGYRLVLSRAIQIVMQRTMKLNRSRVLQYRVLLINRLPENRHALATSILVSTAIPFAHLNLGGMLQVAAAVNKPQRISRILI